MSTDIPTQNKNLSGLLTRYGSQGSIATRLLATACIFFVISTCIIVYFSLRTQREAFYSYANDLCLTSNSLTAYAIDGDALERFAKQMEVTPEYKKFVSDLDGLSATIHAKYLYVLSDNNVPGMYTYIYDATHSQEFPGERYALGRNESKEEYVGADVVLSTGQPFKSAKYYNEKYGELFYAYAPILNSKGKVVAFVGTDIDISPLNTLMDGFVKSVGLAFALAFGLFFISYQLMVRRIYTRPMRALTDSALRLSRGELDLHIPDNILRRQDDLGQVAQAFEVANEGVNRLSTDTEQTLRAIHHGDFTRRADAQRHQGAYQRVIQGLNKTIDGICRHFDDMSCAVAFLDGQGRVLYANKTVEFYTQWENLQSTDVFLSKLVMSGQENGPDEAVQALFVREASPQFDNCGAVKRIVCFGNARVAPSYGLTLLRCSRDEVMGLGGAEGFDGTQEQEDAALCIMLLAVDISDLTKARMLAEEATSAKSDFLARMSHEIRTPMNAILGLSYLALQGELSSPQRQLLRKLQGAADSLLNIINNILDFSKIEARKLELESAPLSLREHVCAVYDMVRFRAEEKGLDLAVHVVADVPERLLGDVTRVRQILLNLLGNAIKFTDHGGVICEVEMAQSTTARATLRFTVMDSGIGIDKPTLEHLFQPFAQADSSITRRFGGTGLGLVISKELVELLGGQIWVESEPGLGCCFTVLLPFEKLEETATLTSDRRQEDTAALQGARVLLVEDNDINQMIAQALLEQVGVKVTLASNGLEAVQAVSTQTFDLVLMDIQMPVLDGLGAAKRIRALSGDTGQTPIIAMTAHAMVSDHAKSLEAGMNDHVGKPIDPGVLFKIMRRWLRTPRSE